MAPQIKELQLNLNPWRIDWLGEVIYPWGSQQDLHITVHLSELRPDYRDPLSNSSLAAPNRHKAVPVKIGLISLLKIGSVWVDGIEVPSRGPQREYTFTIQHEQVEVARLDQGVSIGFEHQPLLSARRYRIGAQAAASLAASWVALVHAPGPDTKLLAIPCTVIFQKCLATSPKAVQQLAYGGLDKIIDPSSGFLADEPRTYYAELFKDFGSREAKAMANLKADPVARAQYASFRNTLIVARANEDRGKGQASTTHIKVGLPFSNPAQLTVIGKRIPFDIERDGRTETEWGLLATSIVELEAQLVFDKLIIGRKNSSKKGKNANDPDLEPAWGPPTQQPTEPDDPTPITSTDDVDRNLEALVLEASGDFTATALTEVADEKETQRYRHMPRVTEDGTEFNGQGTTGEPSPSGTGTAEADLHASQAPKIPITLHHFLETLQHLADEGYRFDTIAVSRVNRLHESGQGIVNFLRRRIDTVRSWHLSHEADDAPPRGYIVAEALLGATWHYLIELQRKGQEQLALLHVREHAGHQLDPRRIEQFMVDVAKANGWTAKELYRSWVCQPIKHKPSKGPKAFAQAIINKL